MKKKLLSLCVAAALSVSCVSPVFAAGSIKDLLKAIPGYDTKYKESTIDVDTDMELRESGGTFDDGPVSVEVSDIKSSVTFDYRTILYMESVRTKFETYWTLAQGLCSGDTALLNELDHLRVTGEFAVTVEFPSTMTLPAEATTVGKMQGFNDEAKSLFIDTKRELSGNKLTITFMVKDPATSIDDIDINNLSASKMYVEGKTLNDNLDTYLKDMTYTCPNVTITGLGMHTVIGKMTGSTKINGELAAASGDYSDTLATVNYNAVQLLAGGDTGRDKNNIYESVVLSTPTPTKKPHTGSTDSGTGGGSGGAIAPGIPSKETPAPTGTPKAPSTTLTPAKPETTVKLNDSDHFAYVVGYPNGEVKPTGNITRAEVATIVFRLLTDDTRRQVWSQTNSYSDVQASSWYNNAVSTMTNAGVLTGYEDGTFKPDAPITRAEFATIMARFIGGRYSGGEWFSDVSGHWASEYINRAKVTGWVNGYEDNSFRPDIAINRAEAMTLINNALNRHVSIEGMAAVSDAMVKWSDNTPDAWYYTAIQEATNSHNYTRENDTDDETWISLRENKDWEVLESEYSTVND